MSEMQKAKDKCNSSSTAFKLIEELEQQYPVDSIRLSDGTRLWNLLRILFYFYLQKKQTREDTEDLTDLYSIGSKSLLNVLKECMLPLKSPSGKIEVCGFSNTSNRKYHNGKFYDIYIDPLYGILGDDFTVFEWPNEQGYRQNYKDNVYSKNYVPLHIPITTRVFWDIVSHKLFRKTHFRIDDIAILDDVIDYFADTSSVDKETIEKHIKESLVIFVCMKRFFKKLFTNLTPRAVLIVCGYGRINMALSQACREMSIPSIELQHGIITKNHPGYIKTTKSENRDCIPEYLLTYGNAFSDIVKQGGLFDHQKVHAVGFPYLEEVKGFSPAIDTKLESFISNFSTNILITSQWTVADEMKKFIIYLSKELEKSKHDVGIIFKPHPRDWRDYSVIKRHRNIFLASKYGDVYEMLKVADIHSTVYSTSGIEALAFGTPNIFVDVGKTNMKELIDVVDNRTSFMVTSPRQFMEKLDYIISNYESTSKNALKTSEVFFKQNAKKNFEKFLSSLDIEI